MAIAISYATVLAVDAEHRACGGTGDASDVLRVRDAALVHEDVAACPDLANAG